MRLAQVASMVLLAAAGCHSAESASPRQPSADGRPSANRDTTPGLRVRLRLEAPPDQASASLVSKVRLEEVDLPVPFTLEDDRQYPLRQGLWLEWVDLNDEAQRVRLSDPRIYWAEAPRGKGVRARRVALERVETSFDVPAANGTAFELIEVDAQNGRRTLLRCEIDRNGDATCPGRVVTMVGEDIAHTARITRLGESAGILSPFDILFASDDFDAESVSRYHDAVDRVIQEILNTSPYTQHAGSFNFYRIDTVPESPAALAAGACPAGEAIGPMPPDTPISTFSVSGSDATLDLDTQVTATEPSCFFAVPRYEDLTPLEFVNGDRVELIVILSNQQKEFGSAWAEPAADGIQSGVVVVGMPQVAGDSGGTCAFCQKARYLVLHEIGHAFGLHDEYSDPWDDTGIPVDPESNIWWPDELHATSRPPWAAIDEDCATADFTECCGNRTRLGDSGEPGTHCAGVAEPRECTRVSRVCQDYSAYPDDPIPEVCETEQRNQIYALPCESLAWEGALYRSAGVYRPSRKSVMRYGRCYNEASRQILDRKLCNRTADVGACLATPLPEDPCPSNTPLEHCVECEFADIPDSEPPDTPTNLRITDNRNEPSRPASWGRTSGSSPGPPSLRPALRLVGEGAKASAEIPATAGKRWCSSSPD